MTGLVTTVVIKDGNGNVIPGGVRQYDLSGVATGPNTQMWIPSDLSGNAIDLSLPSQVVGSVAAGSTDTGNPVKVGAVFNSAPLASYTNGQRGDLQINSKGVLWTQATFTSGAGSDGFSNSQLALPLNAGNGTTQLLLGSASFAFNGTTWDRNRKPNAVSRIPSAAASTNPTSAKASAGDAWKATGYNAKASVVYLKLYSKASAPTVGTDTPFMTIALAPSAAFNIDFAGLYMGTGIAYGFTTDAADNGTTALSAGDILGFSLSYA